MGEHTPTPLSIQFEPHNGFGGNDPDGEPWPFGYISTAPLPRPIFELRPTLAFTPEEFRTYAAFIVKAVNSYADLVKALEEIRDHWANQYDHPRKEYELYRGPYGVGVTDGHRACAIIACEALAKATS